jgi:hypothetical protein
MLMKDVTVDGPFDWLRLEVLPGAFTDSLGMHPSARQISRRSPGNDSPKFEILVISPRYDWV